MALSTKLERELVSWLETYGATDVEIDKRGKHPKAIFHFRGKRFQYVFPGSQSDNYRGDKNRIADLKRILGNPVVRRKRKPRSMEDMLSVIEVKPYEPPTRETMMAPSPSIQEKEGTIALYSRPSNRKRMEFKIPIELTDKLRGSAKELYLSCERLRGTGEAWQLRKASQFTGSKMASMVSAAGLRGVVFEGPESLYINLGEFGASLCKYSLVDDAILAELDLANTHPKKEKRQPKPSTNGRKTEPPRTEPTTPAWRLETPSPMPTRPQPAPVAATSMEVMPPRSTLPFVERLRGLLVEITEIENSTGYTLGKHPETKKWRWRAPVIEVD